MFPASRAPRAGIAVEQDQGEQGDVEPGLVHSKSSGRLRSFSCCKSSKSTPTRRHTRRLRQHRLTDHPRRNRSPGTTTAGGWMIRDSQGRRHHRFTANLKEGIVLFFPMYVCRSRHIIFNLPCSSDSRWWHVHALVVFFVSPSISHRGQLGIPACVTPASEVFVNSLRVRLGYSLPLRWLDRIWFPIIFLARRA